MTAGMLKKWITDTLKNDTEFRDFCIATVGKELSYYRSAPINEVVETLPFCTVYSDEYEHNARSEDTWNKTWNIPLAIGITSNDESIDDNGVTVWDSTDKVEEIAMRAIDILTKESFSCGVKNEPINLIDTQMMITEIGEADDTQASLFITFGKLNGI